MMFYLLNVQLVYDHTLYYLYQHGEASRVHTYLLLFTHVIHLEFPTGRHKQPIRSQTNLTSPTRVLPIGAHISKKKINCTPLISSPDSSCRPSSSRSVKLQPRKISVRVRTPEFQTR